MVLSHATCEAVSRGHPDKIADQLSDLTLDLWFRQCSSADLITGRERARGAVEVLVTGAAPGSSGAGISTEIGSGPPVVVVVAGEIGRQWQSDAEFTEASAELKSAFEHNVVRFFVDLAAGAPEFIPKTLHVTWLIQKQSVEIAEPVNGQADVDLGAGDQGIVVGYATNETDTFLPIPLHCARTVLRYQRRALESGGELHAELGPDAKTQATICHGDGESHLTTLILSTQHSMRWREDDQHDMLKQRILEFVVKPALADLSKTLNVSRADVKINEAGTFVLGGPAADCGLTGRKIVTDAYGPQVPVGGGAFSGKDPSKVDRSAAYAARQFARHVVESGRAAKCRVEIAFAIGGAEPVSVEVETFHTAKGLSDSDIAKAIRQRYGTVQESIQSLNLFHQLSFAETASDGHMGRDFPWERPDPRFENLLSSIEVV